MTENNIDIEGIVKETREIIGNTNVLSIGRVDGFLESIVTEIMSNHPSLKVDVDNEELNGKVKNIIECEVVSSLLTYFSVKDVLLDDRPFLELKDLNLE